MSTFPDVRHSGCGFEERCKSFTNNSSKRATFDAATSDQVSNTTESDWSQTNTVEVGQKIKYGISFLGTGGGGETSLTYSRSWGQGGSESQSITVGSESGVHIELEPGESVDAQLTASRGVMKVRLIYQAQLIGCTAVNYNPTFKDHHVWGLDINGVMQAGGLASTRDFTEDIEIGFYSNSRIVLKDSAEKMVAALATADRPSSLA